MKTFIKLFHDFFPKPNKFNIQSCGKDWGWLQATYWVALYQASVIIGVCALESLATKHYLLHSFCIDKKQQNKGVGSEFFGKLFSLFKRRNKGKITLDIDVLPDNFIAIQFYKKLGFKRINKKILHLKHKKQLKKYKIWHSHVFRIMC